MRKLIPYIILISLMTACVTLVKEAQIHELRQYENLEYNTLKDINAGTKTIPKGKKIKIIIKANSDWIKVYGYEYNVPLLDSERTLILYLFQEDFPQKKFTRELFINKLYESIKPVEKNKK